MNIGTGIAIAGVWFGAGIMTIALAFGGVLTGLEEAELLLFVAPPVCAAIATIFIAMFATAPGS